MWRHLRGFQTRLSAVAVTAALERCSVPPRPALRSHPVLSPSSTPHPVKQTAAVFCTGSLSTLSPPRLFAAKPRPTGLLCAEELFLRSCPAETLRGQRRDWVSHGELPAPLFFHQTELLRLLLAGRSSGSVEEEDREMHRSQGKLVSVNGTAAPAPGSFFPAWFHS